MLLVPLLTRQLLDHIELEGIEECEIYWQGGEAMIMGPAWFVEAGRIMDEAAAARGRRFTHYLQTNLISYSPAWNDVLYSMFGGSLGTSMDFPNLHRKLFSGSAEAYTAIWTQRLREAQAAGLGIGVIAVLHQGSLDAGPDAFYRYYTEELGLKSFQVNTPFPGGPAKIVEAEFNLDKTALAEFLAGLFDIWMERGHANGVALGPFDSLIHHFTGAPALLPIVQRRDGRLAAVAGRVLSYTLREPSSAAATATAPAMTRCCAPVCSVLRPHDRGHLLGNTFCAVWFPVAPTVRLPYRDELA